MIVEHIEVGQPSRVAQVQRGSHHTCCLMAAYVLAPLQTSFTLAACAHDLLRTAISNDGVCLCLPGQLVAALRCRVRRDR